MEGVRVPSFYLYGEPHRAVADGFVHVEDLDDRSRPSEWTIRAHSHAELNHLFMIAEGGGTMSVEAERHAFVAPALLVVPATVVHGFAWEANSRGWVMTTAQSHLEDIAARQPDLRALFASARAIPLSGEEAREVDRQMNVLRRELGWAVPGHGAVVEAAMLNLMVLALRKSHAASDLASPAPGHQAALVARFRHRIEERFRLRESVADHAAALGLTEGALRAACARIAARSPSAMLDDRAVLEAQRALLYSNLSVAEIGYSIGFNDPAYFSRFFARHAGCSPRTFRERRSPGAGTT